MFKSLNHMDKEDLRNEYEKANRRFSSFVKIGGGYPVHFIAARTTKMKNADKLNIWANVLDVNGLYGLAYDARRKADFLNGGEAKF